MGANNGVVGKYKFSSKFAAPIYRKGMNENYEERLRSTLIIEFLQPCLGG